MCLEDSQAVCQQTMCLLVAAASVTALLGGHDTQGREEQRDCCCS